LTLIVGTVTDGDVGGSHLVPHALIPRQSGTVHGFSRITSTAGSICLTNYIVQNVPAYVTQ